MRVASLLVSSFVFVACAGAAPEPALAPAGIGKPKPDPPPAPAPPASAPASPDAPAPTDPTSLTPEDSGEARAANDFTTKLYARMRTTPGNTMISGTSLRAALTIAALGARGETAREMAAVLAIPADPTKAATAAKAELAAWQEARGKAELVVANRLWGDKTLALKDDFTRAASDAFGAGAAEPADFKNAPDVARRAINAWVAEKTADKIQDLLPEGAVDKRTRLVVTNATYFKARWSTPFEKSETKDEPFKAAPNRTHPVPMMHATNTYRFAQASGAKVLMMHYDGSQLAMLFVLPDDANGLAKVEEGLSAETFAAWAKAPSSQRVAVSLPRFSFKAGGPVEGPLQQLGMKAAFSGKADFSGLADGPPGEMQISRAVQRTWVSVDEIGTEAAAASGAVMGFTSAHMGPIAEFKADHPFLFFVYDAKRGRILFAGRVADPRP